MLQANETLSANAQQIKLQAEQIAQLEEQIATLQGNAQALPTQTAAYEALLSGYVAFVGNDHLTAATNLENIDTTQLSPAALEIYNTVWTTVSVNYYETLFNTGYNSYVAENFPEAISNLLRVVNKDMSYKDGTAAYYLAQAYRKSGDNESAKPYYQYVIDNYPDTQHANTAKNYVN